MTISRHLKFGTTEMLTNQKTKTILNAIKQLRDFRINYMLMDGQFELLWADLADLRITLNTMLANAHIPEIQRRICTIKERIHCIYHRCHRPSSHRNKEEAIIILV
jgi:hypothetical protein